MTAGTLTSVYGGASNTVSGTGTAILGGWSNAASGLYSVLVGEKKGLLKDNILLPLAVLQPQIRQKMPLQLASVRQQMLKKGLPSVQAPWPRKQEPFPSDITKVINIIKHRIQ